MIYCCEKLIIVIFSFTSYTSFLPKHLITLSQNFSSKKLSLQKNLAKISSLLERMLVLLNKAGFWQLHVYIKLTLNTLMSKMKFEGKHLPFWDKFQEKHHTCSVSIFLSSKKTTTSLLFQTSLIAGVGQKLRTF